MIQIICVAQPEFRKAILVYFYTKACLSYRPYFYSFIAWIVVSPISVTVKL